MENAKVELAKAGLTALARDMDIWTRPFVVPKEEGLGAPSFARTKLKLRESRKKKELEVSNIKLGGAGSPKSESVQPDNKHDHDDPRPDYGTRIWQDLTELVLSVPQDEVQERKDDEREEPARHTVVVHLCAVKLAK